MTDLAYWASILLFPAGAIVVALAGYLVQLRAEARWRAEAASKHAHTAAE